MQAILDFELTKSKCTFSISFTLEIEVEVRLKEASNSEVFVLISMWHRKKEYFSLGYYDAIFQINRIKFLLARKAAKDHDKSERGRKQKEKDFVHIMIDVGYELPGEKNA